MKTSNLLKVLSCIITICIHTGLNAQIGINTDTIDASAVLQISAGNRGLLIPSLDDTGYIVKPADGLVFYHTKQKAYYIHTDNTWKIMVPFEILKDNDTSISTNYNITIKRNVSFQENVTAKGNVTASNITSNGNITAKGTLTANGNITANNTITAIGAITSKGKVTVNDSVTVNGNISALSYSNNVTGNGPVPKGCIVMWSGDIDGIFDKTGKGLDNGPLKGWALCKGQKIGDTKIPDLTNRFIVGAGDRYQPGYTGGKDSVALKIEEMPRHRHDGGEHTHDILAYKDTWCCGDKGLSNPGPNSDGDRNDVGQAAKPSTIITNYTGGLTGMEKMENTCLKHENRPPYYALAYIIKL